MTANHDLERRVARFYATEAPHRAPDRVLGQALATIEHTRQRRELRFAPRRFPTMNVYLKLAAAAVAVLAVAVLGLNLIPRSPGQFVGGPASPPPSATPSPTPQPSPAASPSAALTPAPLSATYTSELHGLSVRYPEGWTVHPATSTDATIEVDWLQPGNDFLYDPDRTDNLFFVLGSYPLAEQTGEAWAAAALTSDTDCADAGVSTTIDGAPGLICGKSAVTWSGDRGYGIKLYVSPDDPSFDAAYDQAWFEELLATVRLP
jgi:hypothetical protein